MRLLPMFTASLLLFAAPAVAQQTATAKSGEETRVGWIGSLKADCTANPAPTVRPAKVADNGQIKLTKGEVTTNQVPNCPGAKVPAIVVFYTSAKGYTGPDTFTLAAEGGAERTFQITVE